MMRTRCFRQGFLGLLLSAGLLLAVRSTDAWNPPPGTDHYGPITVNGQKSSLDYISYFADMTLPAGGSYHRSGHAYILEHAIEILKKDGYTNWAAMAEAYLSHLLGGARHADAYKGRVTAALELEVLWGLFSEDLYEWDLTCVGGCDHYYNISDGTGLNMSNWDLLGKAASYLLKILTTVGFYEYTYGLLNLDIEIRPDLKKRYDSNVDLCEKHFAQALDTWENGTQVYDQRSAQESAIYDLGWACHLIADLHVAQHLHERFFGAHSDYEDQADGKGGPDDSTDAGERDSFDAYHATSAKGYYHFNESHPTQGWSAAKLARAAAVNLDQQHPENYGLADSDDPKQRDAAQVTALPLAEQWTAALIAEFMCRAGVPKTTPPLSGYVRQAHGGGILPGAYVFYGEYPISPIEQNLSLSSINLAKTWKGWNVVRANANGHYSVTLKPNHKYWIRPVMPGYAFRGVTNLNAEFGTPTCPVVYTQPNAAVSGDIISFTMEPLAKLAKAVPLTASPSNATMSASVDPALFGRRTTLLEKTAVLPLSKARLSPALDEAIYESLMTVACTQHVLGVKGSQTGKPEESVISIGLSNLMEIEKAQVLTSTPALLSVVDRFQSARRSAGTMTTTAAALPGAPISTAAVGIHLTTAQWQAVKSKLPVRQVTTADGRVRRVYTLSAKSDGSQGAQFLLENGLIAIPSKGGAEIEVSLVHGPGLLGADTVPLRLTTDADGSAYFRIKSGNQAGTLRLQFTVVKNPEAVQILPSRSIDILVQPPLQGCDPAVETSPVLESVSMLKAHLIRLQPLKEMAAVAAGVLEISPEGARIRDREARPERPAAEPIPGRAPERNPGFVPGVVNFQDFDGPSAPGWEFAGGAKIEREEGNGILGCSGRGQGLCLDAPRPDFRLSFRYRQGRGAAEIDFKHKGDPSHPSEYALLISGRDVTLIRRDGGRERGLDQASTPLENGRWYAMAVDCAGPRIAVSIDDRPVLSVEDREPLPPGAFVFGCRDGAGIGYDDVRIEPPVGTPGGNPEPGFKPQPGAEPVPRPDRPPVPEKPAPDRPPVPVPEKPIPDRPPVPAPDKTGPDRLPVPGKNDRQSGDAPVDLRGAWISDLRVVYRISQNGSEFSWTVETTQEQGHGTLNGRNLNVSWENRQGKGSAKGTVTEVSQDGRALTIRWSSGIVFRRQR